MTPPRNRFTPLLLVILIVAISWHGRDQVGATPQAAGSSPAGLESVFEAGLLLEDRNGDTHIDFVSARLVLADGSDPAEIAAAADIAARLGFETSSMDLPLAGDPTSGLTSVVVGNAALTRVRIDSEDLFLHTESGDGVIALHGEPGSEILLVVSDTPAGTRAAAAVLAGRLPHVWDLDGPTLADLCDAVATILSSADVETLTVRVPRLVVAANGSALQRLEIDVTVVAGTLEAAALALEEAAREERELGAAQEKEAGAPEEEKEEEEVPAGLLHSGLRTMQVTLRATDGQERVVEISGPDVEEITEDDRAEAGRRPGPESKSDLDLANLYGNAGLLGDSDSNLIPDRVDVVLSPAAGTSRRLTDVAARLGLESTGVTIPIAIPADDLGDPSKQPTLVLVGRDHPAVGALLEEETLRLPDLQPGEGLLQVVPEAFGDGRALVIVGADPAGEDRALQQLAERLPHIWERGKDRTTLEEVSTDLWLALSSRSPVGQAATALYKLDDVVDKLADIDLESARVSVHVEKAEPALADFIRQRLDGRLRADALEVVVENIDVQDARVIIDEEIEVASEVDEFWQRFRAQVLPAVQRGRAARVHAGLSEPPEIRAAIEKQALSELVAAGANADTSSVRVLSAYKQGYSWLYDQVRPALAGKAVDSLIIRFAEIGAPEGWPQQAMYTPTRWLLEVFPIDEVLARDLDLDLEQISFEKMPPNAPAYEAIAKAADGSEILRQTFEPRLVLRPYFDRFPDYEMARVTTGWISAWVNEAEVLDERIVTDLERFWDHFQSDTLMRMYEQVMLASEGKPRAADAPHFGTLRVEVSLSEPDYKLGIDEEQVASMEALHEEIYFGVLHFFDVMGRLATGSPLSYPGRVIPVVRPKSDGAAGSAHITFTGFDANRPAVIVDYKPRDGWQQRERRDILPLELDKPRPLAARVRAGVDGIEQLDFHVHVDFELDRRDEFVRRRSASYVDRNISSAEQIQGIIDNIANLREKGLYEGALAYHDLGTLQVAADWSLEIDPETQLIAALPANGSPAPFPTVSAFIPPDYLPASAVPVQWETPIPPPEARDILAMMSTFPQATVYKAGESYLGRDIWAMDLMAPLQGSHWSQAKATTLKPTVIYSGRQHANEVSSTSHLLRLAELLLTDPAYDGVLDKVNVVVHPITNPDGAQLAYDLARITPNHMLHAAYLGSLGVDVTRGAGDDDPIYPESKVRPRLWREWLPDLFLNPHGYPSHEWVQVFSEYAAWVRTRATEARDWWGMRGWFMPGFSYIDDPEFPDHKAAAFEIRDRITEKINGDSEVRALNTRAYDRYRRYTYSWDSDNFKLDFTNDVLIYSSIKGSRAGDGGVMSNPRVTIWSGSTEAPDETAFGDWLELVARAGLEWDKALLEYLLEGNHEIERTHDEHDAAFSLKLHRPRPPTPPEEEADLEDESNSEVSQQ